MVRIFYLFEIVYQSLVESFRFVQLLRHDAFARLAVVDVLPQFFGDERHERMQLHEQGFEELQGLFISGTVNGLSVGGLHHFEVPA